MEKETINDKTPSAVDEVPGISMSGHLLIVDDDTGEILVNKRTS